MKKKKEKKNRRDNFVIIIPSFVLNIDRNNPFCIVTIFLDKRNNISCLSIAKGIEDFENKVFKLM